MNKPPTKPIRALRRTRRDEPAWVWKGAGTGAGLLGGLVARKLINGARSKVSSRRGAPLNPGDERTSWPYALFWAGLIGIGAAIVRLLALRVVAAVWTRRTGRPVAEMPD
ncbi:MAG: DUF4235 domain-containing protein [Ilumatobacteraceae bacterium]